MRKNCRRVESVKKNTECTLNAYNVPHPRVSISILFGRNEVKSAWELYKYLLSAL